MRGSPGYRGPPGERSRGKSEGVQAKAALVQFVSKLFFLFSFLIISPDEYFGTISDLYRILGKLLCGYYIHKHINICQSCS